MQILGLIPLADWETKQAPFRRQYLRAMAALPGVQVHISGPGWPDWQLGVDPSRNIERVMPECDAIYGYRLASIQGMHAVATTLGIVVAEAVNECWPTTPAGECQVVHDARLAGVTLLVHHHQADAPRLEPLRRAGVAVHYIPHGAPPEAADYARPWEDRHGVLLTGRLHPEHYPLRCRFARLIGDGKIPGAILVRPPYRSTSLARAEAQAQHYYEALGRARVKLGCMSRWGYLLHHYSEAALAGCVHVSDVPDDPGAFALVGQPVEASMSDRELVAAVRYAMERADRAIEARYVARHHFTTAHYAQRFVAAVEACR